MVPIVQKYMTLNDCYTANRRLTSVEYLIAHATASPGVMAADWFERWNKPGVAKCVQAFLDDKVIMQYLPWAWRGWQIGTSWGNSNSIGVEMCEDIGWKEDYFLKAKRNMVELFAMLAVKYNVPTSKIIGHYEAYQLGIASNHGDPKHWWSKFNYTMDDFRREVGEEIIKMDVIRQGMTGDAVRKLQVNLTRLGYDIAMDGSFGPGTLATVKKFQMDNGLEADGIAGPATQAKIAELLTPAPVVVPEPVPVPVPVVVPGPEASWKCSIEIPGLTFDQAKALKVQYPESVLIAE